MELKNWDGILQLVSGASWALLTPSACDCCKDPYFKGLVAFWNWSTRHGVRVVTRCHPIPQVSSRTIWNWQSRSFSMVLVAASSNSRVFCSPFYTVEFFCGQHFVKVKGQSHPVWNNWSNPRRSLLSLVPSSAWSLLYSTRSVQASGEDTKTLQMAEL